MDKIAESGMKGVCIEARPHPDFVGDQWWSDLDLILAKAKENEMRSGFSMILIFQQDMRMEK